MCTHPEDKIRFLTCSAADRFPGVWVCDVCGDSFQFDPTGKTSVRYLEHANANATKVLRLEPEVHKDRMEG